MRYSPRQSLAWYEAACERKGEEAKLAFAVQQHAYHAEKKDAEKFLKALGE